MPAYKKPSFHTIALAVDGDEIAIERILAHYDSYINKVCLRPTYDTDGNMSIAVDPELKGRIREAVIRMILRFEIQ